MNGIVGNARLEQIRQQTLPAHDQLEQCSCLTLLLSVDCTVAHYHTALLAASLAWTPVETALAERWCLPAILLPTWRKDLLWQDRQQEGLALAQQSLWPSLLPDSVPQQLAMAYLLHGAEMGLAYIARHSLFLARHYPASHFFSVQRVPHQRERRKALEERLDQEEDVAAVIRNVTDYYTWFAHCLSIANVEVAHADR